MVPYHNFFMTVDSYINLLRTCLSSLKEEQYQCRLCGYLVHYSDEANHVRHSHRNERRLGKIIAVKQKKRKYTRYFIHRDDAIYHSS